MPLPHRPRLTIKTASLSESRTALLGTTYSQPAVESPEATTTEVSGANFAVAVKYIIPRPENSCYFPHQIERESPLTSPKPCSLTFSPLPVLNPRLRSRCVPNSPPLDVEWVVWNGCDLTTITARIVFNEESKRGVGMLDLLSCHDSLLDKYLLADKMFGPGVKEVQLAINFLDRDLPESSAHHQRLPVVYVDREYTGPGKQIRYVTRHEIALRIAFLYWQYQHVLNLPPFDQLRLISLHTSDGVIWRPEILIL